MTYRDRREARAERLRGWADKRDDKAEAARAAADANTLPFGQPILVGHHSEAAHRRVLKRQHAAMDRLVEHSGKAASMRAKADNIEAAAAHAIYSDDEDAIERLRERVAELEAQRETMKATNAAFRKAHRAELKTMSAFARDQALPHPGYELSNLGANINRNRKRLAALEAQR